MIKLQDVSEAIAECEGVRHPNANTCLKLAALYTIRENMTKEPTEPVRYSYATAPTDYQSNTEFGRIVQGKDSAEVLAVMDELMTTLQGMIPRLYDGVLSKLQRKD